MCILKMRDVVPQNGELLALHLVTRTLVDQMCTADNRLLVEYLLIVYVICNAGRIKRGKDKSGQPASPQLVEVRPEG